MWRVTGAAAIAAVLAGGCCQWEAPPPDNRSEVYFAERQTLYVLDRRAGRVDAYGLRNGVAWLGGVRLPGGTVVSRMAREPGSDRLWLRGPAQSYVLDGRRFSLQAVRPEVAAAAEAGN